MLQRQSTHAQVACAANAVHTPWYLVYTKPSQEALADQQLGNQGYETYLPMYRVFKKPRGARLETPAVVHHEPMFPRYLFLRPGKPGQGLSAARSTRGVSHLVVFGQLLATVEETVIEALRMLESERNQAQAHELSPHQPGTVVRLRGSALEGLQGVVVSPPSTRVQILLDILGAQRIVTVRHEQLIAA